MLTALLRQADYEAVSARTQAEALRLARSQSFDLFVMDQRFPDGTGVDLARKIRAFQPETPIVFFSGVARDPDREEALRSGAQAYLAKPDVDGLIKTVQSLLSI
jgi:CheY-like chemotaxis protein